MDRKHWVQNIVIPVKRGGCIMRRTGKLLHGVLLLLWVLLCIGAGASAEEDDWESGFEVHGDTCYINEGIEMVGHEYSEDESIYESLKELDTSMVMDWLRYEYASYGLSEPPSRLQLPSTLRVVGGDAFYAVDSLEELILPEGVEAILGWAFNSNSIERVYLPSTVRLVEPGAFTDSSVKTIEVSPDNPFYTSVDGVLYTKDETTLVAYPPGRSDVHVDVPAGVKVIAPYAFAFNWHLHSVTLPFGLERIGYGAFAANVYLEAVNLPPTLEQVGSRAFANCVLLQKINLPAHTVVVDKDGQPVSGDDVFDNTPMLKDCRMKTQPQTAEQPDDTASPVEEVYLYGIVNPVNARDTVEVFKYTSHALSTAALPCGQTVAVTGVMDDWFRVQYTTDGPEVGVGYMPAGSLYIRRSWEPLFRVASASPAHEHVIFRPRAYYSGLPVGDDEIVFTGEMSFLWLEQVGQLVETYVENGEDGWRAFLDPSDLFLTRYDTHDGKTYGIVISDDPRDRLNLRAAPDRGSESLGKYFGGTQVEILEERGDWYRVLVDWQEGWMMKQFVRIVPVEPEQPEEE